MPADLKGLTTLECQAAGITSLGGLEHATGLTDLSLWENEIADITALAGLTGLTSLQLGSNKIVSLEPLKGLTRLTRLGLSHNQIKSLEPLKGLSGLAWLNLDWNKLPSGELAKLSGLKKIKWLTVEHNGVTDTSSLNPLASAGAEVYSEYRVASDALTVADLMPQPGAGLKRPGPGRLVASVGPAGGLDLAWASAGMERPVVAELAQPLTLQGSRVMAATPRGPQTVGRLAGPDGRTVELCMGAAAGACQAAIGYKAGARGQGDLLSLTLQLADAGTIADAPYAKDTDLMPYVFASPNQLDAGTCLFMSNTGAMEILMNQGKRAADIKYKGKTDLSERFLINASRYVPTSAMKRTIMDLIYAYESLGGSMLDKDYPFTVGYLVKDSSGSVSEAKSTDSGAYLSAYYNWLNKLPTNWQQQLVPTPKAARTTIYVDPLKSKNSVWNVGLMTDDMVERIKWELRTKNAPVVVLYNHYLYWHADIVVGYDDTVTTTGCPMVQSSLQYFQKKGATSYIDKIKKHMAAQRGCSNKGIFYVRDSIYDGGAEEKTYVYSTSPSYSEKYSKRIIKRSYNWVKYLGNHAYTVHRR